MRAPPWIAVSPIQHLTEEPSCEAEHKTAPDQNAKNIESTLAMREPSTQDIHYRARQRSRFTRFGPSSRVSQRREPAPLLYAVEHGGRGLTVWTRREGTLVDPDITRTPS